MSIELEVRLGEKEFALSALWSLLSDRVSILVTDEPHLSFSPTQDVDTTIGRGAHSFYVRAAAAELFVICTTIGPEDKWHDQGGWWLTMSVTMRTMESLLLLILVSSCVAEIIDAPIVDESGILGNGMTVPAADVFSMLDLGRKLHFAEAAQLIGTRLGVSLTKSA